MNITNKHGFPDAIVRAIQNDNYSKAGSDFSVTQLIDPPQLRWLMHKHFADISEDVSDRLWALYGQSIHGIIERARSAEDIAEQRFYMPTSYGIVSGQIDLYTPADGVLSDFKVTSVYKIKRALKEAPYEWTWQLNMQAELMRHAGIDPEHLQIVALARDWQKGAALRDHDYPQRAVRIPIEKWNSAEAHDLIEERAHLHWQAMHKDKFDGCKDRERWKREDQYAVMKKGGKRALRLLDSVEETRAWLKEKGYAEEDDLGGVHIVDGIYVETRPGAYVRCAEYCPVSPFCGQFQGELDD